jgi:hypothetical protein
MRTRSTRAGLLTRLERLECRVVAADHRIKLRFGDLKRLPREYTGERHVVIARYLPNKGNEEWVEFEEVPGPDPNPPQRHLNGSPKYLDVMFVEARKCQHSEAEAGRGDH